MRPILFGTKMVRAILDGRKTRTRRPLPGLRNLEPGTRLWVREAFRRTPDGVIHRADGGEGPWRPSIHMPRDCARIMLLVTDVHAESLAGISEAEALAEGVAGRREFLELWKSLYGRTDCEVQVVGFEVLCRTRKEFESLAGESGNP